MRQMAGCGTSYIAEDTLRMAEVLYHVPRNVSTTIIMGLGKPYTIEEVDVLSSRCMLSKVHTSDGFPARFFQR